MKKAIGTEKRNIRLGVSLTKTDYNTLNKLSKKTKLSKAEIVIRAIKEYKMQIELNKNLLDKVYESKSGLTVGGLTVDSQSSLTADRAKAEERRRIEAEKALSELALDSKALIGDVEKVYDSFSYQNWGWISFYNGWLEGRLNLLNEQKAAIKGFENQNLYSDYYE